MLDERKQRILRAIVDDYISTAEPIGSRTIAKKYSLGISPATIRNEMADLETLLYQASPYLIWAYPHQKVIVFMLMTY